SINNSQVSDIVNLNESAKDDFINYTDGDESVIVEIDDADDSILLSSSVQEYDDEKIIVEEEIQPLQNENSLVDTLWFDMKTMLENTEVRRRESNPIDEPKVDQLIERLRNLILQRELLISRRRETEEMQSILVREKQDYDNKLLKVKLDYKEHRGTKFYAELNKILEE
ncbi:groL, partial [Acrasis kona]